LGEKKFTHKFKKLGNYISPKEKPQKKFCKIATIFLHCPKRNHAL